MNKNAANTAPQFVAFPTNVVEQMQITQQLILAKIEGLNKASTVENYLTANEFMDRLKISRATFDDKRANNEIDVIVKGRKIYVRESEVTRYMEGR